MSQREEVVLSGGHLTPVVRVGDTVRRAAGPWTPAVHALLGHLHDVGLEIGPRSLGMNTRCFEMLSFIEGEVPSGGASPPWLWTDATLAAVARLIRTFHDASAGFQPPAGATWQSAGAAPGGGPVICHNDLAPWNTVFRSKVPVAFIDWDLAAPGPRAWDVAFAIWHFVPLYGEGDPFAPDRLGPRVRLFCDAYGLDDGSRHNIVDVILERQKVTYATFQREAGAGEPAYVRLWEAGAGEGILRQIDFLIRHRREVEQNLG